MEATTRKPGFYATGDSTYYVAESGASYCVQTDDLRECPFRVAEVPAGATECDDLLTGEEQARHIAQVESF
jgi:hypothetical protein